VNRVLLVVLFVLSFPSMAQDAHREIIREKLQADLEAVIDNYEGVAGVHIIDLSNGDRWGYRDDLQYPQASAIKVPVLLEMTDEVRTLGSGVLRYLTDGGSSLSLEDYAIYMIKYSDNTGTNVLIDELGMPEINALSASLGAEHTLLQRKMIRPDQSAIGNENLSTPRDAAAIMERIATCNLPMNLSACARVREILEMYKDGPIRTPVPEDIAIAFKPGGITGVSTVWGIVNVPDRPYVIVAMSNYGGNGGAVIESISRLAYDYFSRLSGITEYGTRVPLDVKEAT
jgi:beta-lactamase class A